jgi:hypothetical protein
MKIFVINADSHSEFILLAENKEDAFIRLVAFFKRKISERQKINNPDDGIMSLYQYHLDNWNGHTDEYRDAMTKYIDGGEVGEIRYGTCYGDEIKRV